AVSSQTQRKRRFAAALAVIAAAAISMQIPRNPIPMHTSPLTGAVWLADIMSGHPLRFKQQLGINRHVFRKLSNELQTHSGLCSSKYVS
ncbi:hypothetical protein BDN72DRAFT_737295, partial [Pluteus cervinus]